MVERLFRFVAIGLALVLLVGVGWMIRQGAQRHETDSWGGTSAPEPDEKKASTATAPTALPAQPSLAGAEIAQPPDRPDPVRPAVTPNAPSYPPQRGDQRQSPGKPVRPTPTPPSTSSHTAPANSPTVKRTGQDSAPSRRTGTTTGGSGRTASSPARDTGIRDLASYDGLTDEGADEGTDTGTDEPYEPWGEIFDPLLIIPGNVLAASVSDLLSARGWKVQGVAYPKLTMLHALEVIPHEGMPWILEYPINARVTAPVIYLDLDVEWSDPPYEVTKVPIDVRFTWVDPEEPGAVPYHIDTEFYYHPDPVPVPYRLPGTYVLAIANWRYNTGITIDDDHRQLALRVYEWQEEFWKRHPEAERPPVLIGFRIVIGPAIKDHPLTLRIHRLDVTW